MILEPHNTVEFLNQLKAKGLNDEQFQIVHFKAGETIKKHLNYAKSKGSFHQGSKNQIVCLRLQYMINHMHNMMHPDELTSLAKDAAKQYSIKD